MSKAAATEYAATYGNLFKNITTSARQNANVTAEMLRGSAVVASKTGRTVEDVMSRIRSGLLGNTEAIEDLGINVNVAMLEVTDAFKQIADGRSWEKLTFYEQQQIRTLAILEQIQKNYGTEVAQANALVASSFSGSLRDLSVAFGQLAAIGITPTLKGLTWLIKGVTGVTESIATANPVARASLGIMLASALAIPAVSLATKGLAAAKLLYGKALAILIPAQWSFAAALKATFGWLTIIAAAFAVISTVAGALYKHFAKPLRAQEKANATLDDTKTAADGAALKVGDLTKGIKGLEKAAKRLAPIDALNVLGGSSGLATKTLVDVEMSGLEDAFKGISDLQFKLDDMKIEPPKVEPDLFEQWWRDAQELWTILSNGEGFPGIWENWKTGWAWIWENMQRGWSESWQNWKTGAEDINMWFGATWNRFKAQVRVDWELTKTTWSNFWRNWKTGAEETKSWFKDTWGNFVSSCKTGNWDWLIEDWNQLWEWWKLGWVVIKEWLQRTFGNLFDDYKATGGGSRSSSTKSAGGRDFGGRAGGPPYRGYATGGVFTSPTVGVFGENGAEVVMPLEKNTGWIDQLAARINSSGDGGGGEINITMPVYLEGQLIDTISKKINRRAGQGGRRVIPV